MSTFNLSSKRSSHSPLRVQSSDVDHHIAHEVLLVAILKHIGEKEGTKSLLSIGNSVDEIIKASYPTACRIASDLINEAKENLNK